MLLTEQVANDLAQQSYSIRMIKEILQIFEIMQSSSLK